MDIKSVFEITKADRYTQDGRDQIAKIQETEDKTYQIGEISQKTGLQKTANGWVPPKETKYGKVTEKNGQVGVQQKLGKGSKFEAFKNESAAKKALANYTAGYNTTERSKQDPHSDQARLMKHLDKETEQMARENKKKSAAYMDEQGLHDIYMDIKNNELEDYTVEEIAKEYRITKGDAEVIKNRIENNKRAKKQDKQDRKDQAAAGADPQLAKEIANGNHFEEQKKEAAKAKKEAELKQQRDEGEANAEAYRKRYEAEHGPNPGTATTPKRESVSAGRMQKDLDGNFWSRPEDFKEDITSRGWDIEEMNNEYAVISNEAGSQYEVRFDDHSDDGDLTVRTFKPLMIDEDDDDDDIDDSAPRQLTGDTKIKVRK